MAVRP